ncbi:MAG: hypothetical protein AAGA85_24705 [Bacteroidota bacterium]
MGTLKEAEWDAFQTRLTPVSFKKGEDVFPATEICNKVLFITHGVLASEYHFNNDLTITRFFKSKGHCSNIISLFQQKVAHDRIFAITNVEGVIVPVDLWQEHYLYSDGIGLYFRKKMIEILLEDKEFMTIKTLSGVQGKLAFLQENYPEVILETPWKYIANFMGVTPAWLSRTLKKKEVRKKS